MADDEEIEEYEYYYEETIIEEGEEVEPKGSGPAGPSGPAVSTGQPERKRVKKKIDTSKFMTPYLAHSKKMQDIFSQNKYKEKYEKHRGEPYAITTDTPELRRIKKAQNQLSEVKYRMGGQIARTDCHVDEKARDIEHAKKVSQQVSKVLYKQNWEDTKEKYLLPPDAPELVQAVKNTTLFSKKLYTADWDEDKTLYFPYSDSPELRRVAKAQKALSDINYKKGHNEQKLQFSSVADRPDIEMAKKVTQQLSDVKYREDYQKKIRGKWSQTPCYEIAVARMNADNLSDRKYQEDFENIKDQINFVQTETPEYKVNKKARLNASTVQYKADYEKSKGPTAYHTLPATENPLLRQLRVAGNALSDKLYKDLYEKSRGSSINYCDTPKFKIDNVLKNFSDLKYKDHYQKNVVGHYVGSYEDPYMRHCAKVSNIRSDKNYKADYEDEKTNCYFPQTVTQEYEAQKKLNQCKDYVYKQHPDQIAFTQVADSPVIVQAQINSKQLSDLNYKEKYEKEKFKCSIPEDSPFILQSRLNAYNLSDKWYKYDWDKAKAKKFDIKIDAIPLVAAKANRRKASDVEYKKDYEKNKGKMVGALSIQDDPKMLLSAQASRNRSDILYKKDYENSKTKYSAPLDMIPVQMAKKAQSIASNLDYKHLIHSYFYPPDSVNLSLAKKAYTIQSDVDYKSDYNNWVKGCGWVPYGSMDVEKAKKASQILNEKKYRQHPDTIKFTSVEDDPVMVQSKLNQKLRSDILYKSEGEKVIHKYSLPADVPGFIQARVNAYNLSDNYYKQGLEELKSKGYDLKPDAISIKVAKAARHAASDVQYKKNYEKQKGKLVGFRSLQDDPKLVHYMHVAKMQSEREYKKDYEKAKTKYNTPLDMVNVVAAKKAQDIASGIHYKQLRHHYTYLPDAMSIELSKKMMEIQSDNLYKADMNNWMKGIGWIPIGSLDVEKAKKAAAALNEKKYRQHPDTIKFTSVVDSPVMVQAKTNALQLSDKLYKSSGEKIIHKYHLPPDVPQFIQARCNAANVSDKYYKQDWMKTIAKGHHVLGDAISIVAAKSSRNIASDYKYKQAYEKARGKHVGFRSLQDDPKLVHFMDVAKKQSDREYKKDYEKTKTKYHTPLDMVSITAAKKSQEVATNINYKQLVHHYTYLPDAMSVELSRKGMEIQSDNVYKQDYNNWFKGIGWIPLGSLEVEKVKKAGDAISEKKYRQHPDTIKFTSVADSMELALAQSNTKQRSDLLYKAEGEKVKHKYALNPDDPNFIQARVNALNISESNYKANWIKHLAKGYDLKPDAISVKAAKASRNIASDFKYKEAYQKARGKHVGFRSLQDDPKLVHYMHVAKIQSDREYKKDYEKSKTKYHTPLDMFSVTAAKKAQEVSTNATYKQPLHAYTLLPDAMNLELSRNMMQIQSDNLYKSDFNNWLKGVGWVPIGSLDVENAKKIKDYSEKKYRQNPDQWKFSIPTDAMDQVLAKANAQTMNKKLYIDAWEKDKTKIHVMPDTPEILQSRVNQQNTSDKLYKLAWEQHKKKGYDLKPDAISIKAARASRDIASDYKYKKAYEQTRGKHIGFRSLQDDPKLVHFMHVAKMQSDREYKKNYEQSKTKFHTPVDMFSVTAAKLAQNVATNTNYKRLIHSYNLLPDAMPLALTRNMMQIQSDNVYKSEYNECLKGVGWIPYLSQEAEKNKKAMEIVSEKKYRQHPDTLKFTSLPDSMEMVLAKNNALTLNKSLYTQAWEKDKTTIHVMPDAPEFLQAKVNAINISEKKYKEALEKSKKKGYDLRADAISIKAARASRDIASDYKYKKNYEMGRGKMVGFRNLQDDPKLVHYMNVAKMQSDREYKKDYEKTKTKYHTPVTMFSVMAAKEAQAVATNVNYKRLIHKYILLPDAMNVQLAKNMNQIQSDNEYKSDYNAWYKGMGWTPIGSLDVEKSKKAMEIVSEAKYREHPSKFRFTRLTDAMDMELAKQNAQVMNKRKYIDDWEKEKTKIHVMPDTPEILQAKQNMTTFSQKQYRLGWEEAIKKGYDLRPDAISIKAAKASRDIASDFKYKTAYRKQQGHHVGFRSLQDDPKSVWAMHVAKIQSNKEYKKDFEKWKTKFNMPVDMLGFLLAKKCQTLVSDVDYKRPPHNWTCLPDQIAFVQAQKVYEIQSDNSYKADYNEFMRGVGWIPFGSQEAEKNKKAMQIVSEKKYRQHPDKLKFTSLPDSMELVLAKNNAQIMNRKLYTEAWEKDKIQIHVMPDTPEILQAKANLANTSEKLYKSGYEEIKKKGYDLRVDAISIKAAKASRDIASEFKYKAAYRKQQGHHIGFRSLQDDPKSVWAMHVAKIQSDKEYKKDFEKWKTKFNMPVDMLGFLLAKKCQTLVSDIDYKNILHKWTCLPDQNDVVQARKTYEIQSDVAYKADLQWLRGIGWSPIGSLDVEKNKRASLIQSDHKYRQHPDKIRFTSVPDSMEMTLAKSNAEIMNKRLYTQAWNKDKTQIHIMPDTPEVELAKQNKINFSEKKYREAMELAKQKGYDLRPDAISIKAARASRDIASDYKYKTAYRKQVGHHVGCRNILDDPKLVWSMHLAKIQSNREYKKDFEKWKTKFNMPVDMLDILLAKKCQTLVSDIDYRRRLHQWTCLPDQNDVIHARKAYDLQSDNQYKADLQWLKGIGWVPIGSLDVEKSKKAGDIISENKYRQRPDTIKFTSVTDSMEVVLAKANADIMNKRLYTGAWEKDKTTIHIMPDTPEITLARQNKINFSESLYKQSLEEAKKKGYDLRVDAITIKAAKASRDIASDFKYKTGYRKQLGHHVGFRNLQDDPKSVWAMHVAKIQSNREYKKDFEKWKTKFNMPVDMLDILLAKKCQTLVSDIDYKRPLHKWTCLPDQNDVIHARKTYDLQSDNQYKADLSWLRGVGWVPIGSLEVEKNKRAGEILSDHKYRQKPDSIKFTSVTDSLELNLAKANADLMNKRLYTDAWNQDKTTIHVMPDTPEIILAKANRINFSEKLYKLAVEQSKKKGYDLRSDAISIKAAKASRDIVSDFKYKTGYRKQRGHHVGFRSLADDPKSVWAMHVAKIQSDREYKKEFEKQKTKYQSPVEMLSVLLAKNCQKLVSDIDYRHHLHQWTCLPDQNDVIQAKKAYDLQSDAVYKSDLEWLRGIGWVPVGSLEVLKSKRAGEILSDNKYRQKPDTLKFTSIPDSMPLVLAKNNAIQQSNKLYTEAWDTDKRTIHVMPDTPEILLAKSNSVNVSNKAYTQGWEETKKKGYDLRVDAISIKSAKASRNIISDFKYKTGYRKQQGHHIGFRSLADDPKSVWAVHIGKIQSDREYKKEFEKQKTKYQSPVEMLSVLLAKNCQKLVSDIDYRHHLHQWTCLPDQNDVIQAKKAYDLQSDAVYKSDMEWIRGCGWIPNDSLEVNKVKKAQEIISDRKYKQAPDSLKFTSIVDSIPNVLAKANALQINKKLYTEAWDTDKRTIHVMPDTPEILLAKSNSVNVSKKLYELDWEAAKNKGYDLRVDAIPIKRARASRDIASDFKYKTGYRKQQGHHVGFRSLQDDPKSVWAMHIAKIQSDREYKKEFEKQKTKYNTPVEMLSVLLAKNCQKLVSDIDYRHHLHQWTCLPDQNDVIQAKKAYDLQSDAVYKSDLEWIRGCGWMPNGSLEVNKVRKAQEIISDKQYRQNPDTLKFTSVVDLPAIVLSKANALQLSDYVYKDAWNKEKTKFSLPADTPEMVLSKANSVNISDKLYRLAMEENKKKGYDLRSDAISIKAAKASRDIVSDYKYKTGYRKQQGHHVGFRSLQDDPKSVWAMHIAKIQSDRVYKKEFEKQKTKYNTPVEMLSVLLAKNCQKLVSDIDYRHHLHQWTCLPDQNDVIQAKKAYDLQSDAVYKSDLEWIRGCGWIPHESLEVKKVKNAQTILNDRMYRQPASSLKFTSVVDLPGIVLAKTNADQISESKYKEAWETDKRTIHVMPDTPEIMLSRANAINVSNKLYRMGWDKVKMIYDLKPDAIAIKAARASRDIASDYKYKKTHEKEKGHYIGAKSAKDDNKISWYLHASKLPSDLEYKKNFEKTKTKVNLPADMVSILSAKLCQTLVSDIDYRRYLHQWTCLPDQNDVIQAKKAYELQSDAVYKSDLEWIRGIGWMPNDSCEVKKVKHAQDILSERKYRTKPETMKFTAVTDRVDYVSAKQGADILNDYKYREAWNNIKTKYTAVNDSPLLLTAKEAAKNVNDKLYKSGWENIKATGYLLPKDAVQLTHAKKSSLAQSELKYKAEYIKQRGHYIGVSSLNDDPKLRWFKHINLVQNDREYQKNYQKTKSKINIPGDMVSIESAKQGQQVASNIDYRHYLHQWTCHPDQNDCIQAKKAYDLQSDAIYKSDLEWIRGCGWVPLDSVEHKKVRKAQELVNERFYKKDAQDNFSNYTHVVDTPPVVLAKLNSVITSDLKYKETFNLEKGHYIGSADTPQLSHSREMSKLTSEKLYKDSWDSSKALGYQLPPDYWPLVGAKQARLASSDIKYKELHEKEKGHYLAGGKINDFQSVVQSLQFQKMRNMLAYHKAYEDNKTKIHIPKDMLNNVLAKKCQQILSDIEYRHYLHEWTCLPDEQGVIHARKANEILSDVLYKDDLNWLKGLGCYVWDTPEIVRAKSSYNLQSQIKYTAGGKENFKNYSVVTDTPVYVTSVQSAINASDLKYKEDFNKNKDKYTTVLETVDYDRTQNLKGLFSDNIYKHAWDKVKATSYQLPPDAVPLAFAKRNKHIASQLKYREEYEKFKALYTLPKGIQDDPATARCLKVGKLPLDRLYKETYEKNKAKIHIAPDMLEIVSARETQDKVSEIDYRKYLHEWTCLPDLQLYVHARKVNEQLSDIAYKDDLHWLKGIGCFVWDTPEILHAKHAYDLRSDNKYKAKAEELKKTYTSVTDTPVYVQAVTSGKQSSDVVYHSDYEQHVRGKVTSTPNTVDLERASNANKIQSDNLYREDGVKSLPKGYTLPNDTPAITQAKKAQLIGSDVKYKEVYEHIKAKSYTLGPQDVGMVNTRKVNKILNERLYREVYHKQKDKIHTTPDTPEIRQVKATQDAISDLVYKSDYHNKLQGHMISMPFTPQTIHCRYVGEITSDNKYKEDLQWLKGLGCFLYDTPDMVRARDLRKLWSKSFYTTTAKKMLDTYSVVMDTPEYRTVQELKTHLSQFVYRAEGNKQKSIYTSVLDTPDFLRAKKGQEMQSQYLYTEVASKERPHHHADGQTPALTHAKQVKEIISEKKYKAQYEKFKHKYTSVADTPIDLRAKKAYWNASDLRYKESFENAKGKYHTVKDALDIVYHRKVTDDISDVKYKEKYVSQLGIWRSIPDRPEYYHHRAVTDSVSDFKYKEDLTWLKGIGCYAWDTPDFTLAEQNKSLYSGYKYKESFEKTKSKFKYTADNPLFNHFKYATQLANEKLYKADYEKEKTHYSVVVDDPRHLLAKTASEQISQWKYKENYEKGKDKYTAVLDTPENLRSSKASKQISDIVYKLEYNKGKAKGFTSIHDTPSLLHARKVKDRISELKYKELYEKSRGHCTVGPDAVQITTAKDAYKSISNLDYKRKYEATKAQWQWTLDRPDFLQNAKASLQQSDYEYKLDKEYYKGYKLSVTDDKNTVLALKNNEMNSDVKYKKKYEKGTYQGEFGVVADTPQIIHAKSISAIVSDNKYKEEGKKQLPHGTFTTLPERLDTTHVKEVTKLVSDKQYKEKFEKERGKSNYSIMLEPPDVRHAMDVAKVQSNVSYKKQAKANLNYTSIADRPDIQKATQAAKLISDIQYKAKAREEAGRAVSIIGRPDIELAQEVSKLTSQTEYTKGKMWGHGAASYDTPMMRQLKKANELTSNVKYKENFSKDKGKKPQYDLKEAKIYQTFKDAHTLASEVKYKADLKKLHKPVTDMAESLNMQHITSTSKLASEYQYKKEFEKSKGHYHVVPDNLEQLHVKEATELQSQVKYKEKYEKEKGKAMLDFETPTFVTAKEAQHMQSEKEYKKDLEECIKGRNLSGLEVTPALLHVKYATKIASEKEYRKDLDDTIKGRGLTVLEETPELLRAKNATQILNEKEYKKTLETEIKGRGLALALETPDFQRAKNATDIASQIKYKQSAEMDKANYTTVVDTPEIIHAQQVRNLASQKKYKEEAERTMSYYVPVLDTPEMQRVRENQKNFSTLQYQGDLKNIKGKVTVVKDTPEILRVKENQKNFSSIKYKESIGKGTPIPDLPEVKRVKETQKNISSVLYKESLGQGTPTTVTPEIERVKRNQENISMVMYKENLGLATPVPVTPEIERVKRNQENISSVLYKDQFGVGTPTPVTPEMERVKRNQENISSVAYKENLGKGTPTPVTPEMERVKRNQENISMVLYKEGMGKATPTTVTPEMERVKRNQENISSVLYSDSFRKQIQGRAAYVMDTPEMRRVRESQKHISLIKYHEDFEKQKGSFTPVVTDPVTERVKKNMIDFSDINYRGIQRKVVEMERRRNDQEQDVNDLRVWRTNPGSVFDYDPAEDNIQSRSLHMLTVQARRSREQSRSASALSLSAGDEKSELSEAVDHHHSYYSNSGLYTTTVTGHKESSQILFYKGYKQAKTTELPQQRSSSVATQLTTASSVPSHPSTTGKSFKAMYDYRAADDDEVSFKDGDTIVNVQTIDEGWMYGTVQRTGKTGMLPANYLESI
ncbi:nebulin isoform X8 [Xenopus tropicalis]|uniref:Nebulin isoform X8 n=1 Tax=Xenopus tropicalis TaxID=8364 RepID=A0A8J1IUQ4_XENTR|nr:nebulin isoform X8 [Xenopus tropicalis]